MRALRALGVAIGLGMAGCWDNNIPTEGPRPTVIGGRFVRVTGNGAQDTVLTQVPIVTVRLTDSAGTPVAAEQVEVRFLPTTLPLTNQQVTLCSGTLAVVRFGLDTALTSSALLARTDSRGELSIRVARGCRAQTVPLEFYVPRLLVRDTVRFVTLPGRPVGFEVRAGLRVLAIGDTASAVVNFLDRFANGSDAGTTLEGAAGLTVSGRRVTALAVGDWVVRSTAVVGGASVTDTALYSVAPVGRIAYTGLDSLIGFTSIMSVQDRPRVRLQRTLLTDFRPTFLPRTERMLYAHVDTGTASGQTVNIRLRLAQEGARVDTGLFAVRAAVPGFLGTSRPGGGAVRLHVVRSTAAGNRLTTLDSSGTILAELPVAFPARVLSVAPAGDRYVEGSDRSAPSPDSVTTIRDLATGTALLTLRSTPAIGFAWTPDGTRLVVITPDGDLIGFTAATGARYGRCRGASGNFAISPDGRYAGWLVGNQLSYCDLGTERSTLLGCIVPAARCGGDGPQLLWRPDP